MPTILRIHNLNLFNCRTTKIWKHSMQNSHKNPFQTFQRRNRRNFPTNECQHKLSWFINYVNLPCASLRYFCSTAFQLVVEIRVKISFWNAWRKLLTQLWIFLWWPTRQQDAPSSLLATGLGGSYTLIGWNSPEIDRWIYNFNLIW